MKKVSVQFNLVVKVDDLEDKLIKDAIAYSLTFGLGKAFGKFSEIQINNTEKRGKR